MGLFWKIVFLYAIPDGIVGGRVDSNTTNM